MNLTAQYYGLKVKGEAQPCEDCMKGKVQQRQAKKYTEMKSTRKTEHLFMNSSSIKKVSFGGNKYWHKFMDNCTDMCWSMFTKKKSDLIERGLQFLKSLKTRGTPVAYIFGAMTHQKTRNLTSCVNGQVWVFSSNTLNRTLHNTMDELSNNLPSNTPGFEPY